MRRLLVMALILCAAWEAYGESSTEKFVREYGALSSAEPATVERCSRLLERTFKDRFDLSILGPSSAKELDEILRTAGCLDRYSAVSTERNPTQSGAVMHTLHHGVRINAEGEYLFIRIPHFVNVAPAIQSHKPKDGEDGPKKRTVVIDLRNNLGGSTDELWQILNAGFSPHSGVFYMRSVGPDSSRVSKVFRTNGTGAFAWFAIRILVDRNTASASEWLAATLCYEWYPHSCVIIGEKTMGKGVYQCVREIGNVYLKLTCGEWFIEDRRRAGETMRIHGTGLKPDRTIAAINTCDTSVCIAQVLKQNGL